MTNRINQISRSLLLTALSTLLVTACGDAEPIPGSADADAGGADGGAIEFDLPDVGGDDPVEEVGGDAGEEVGDDTVEGDATTDLSNEDGSAAEICDNGEDDDDDDLVDCDDLDCAEFPACLCGNGEEDDGEECDDGDDNSDELSDTCRTTCELAACGDNVIDGLLEEECDDGDDNSDRVPNACRVGCLNPWCGDGLTDDGEQCDDGDDNGEGMRCTAICAFDVEVACSEVPDLFELDEVGERVDGNVRYVGTLAGTTADHVPTADCLDEDLESGVDILLIFRPDADGSYRATTNLPMTVTDTILYRLAACDRPGGLECNDNDGGAQGSTIILRDLSAEQPVFLVVDAVGDDGGPFGLLIEPISDAVGEDEDCREEGVTCGPGLYCMDLGDSLECRRHEAPVLDEIAMDWVSSDAVLHRFRGSDRNRDVEAPDFLSITLGDASSLGPFNFPFSSLRWDGDRFEGTVTVTGFAELNVRRLTASVHDALGALSEILTVDYPEYVAPTEAAEGEACDISRILTTCADGFTCTRNEDGSDTCGAAVAPVLESFSAVRTAADAMDFHFDGTDLNGDVVQWDGVFSDADGAEVFSDTFAFPPADIGRVEFGLILTLFGVAFEVGSEVVTVTAALVDQAGLTSGSLEISLPYPDLTGEGDRCDPSGTDNRCEEPFLCHPDGFGNAFCRDVVGAGDSCDDEELFCPSGYACLPDEEEAMSCDLDPLFPCGFGQRLIDVMAAGEETDLGLLVGYDSSTAEDRSVPATIGCAFAGVAAGGEAIASYTAEEATWVNVTTVGTGNTLDTVLYARINACMDPAAELACNDDDAGTFQSTIEFPMEAGDTAFVFLDAWDVGGVGAALFNFVPLAHNGEACDPAGIESRCEAGHLCDETCMPFTADYCAGIPKIDLLASAEEVDGGLLLTYDTTGLASASDAATADCTSGALGGETVVIYTAGFRERITVTTDLEGETVDTVLYARIDACLDPDAEVACNDDTGSGFQSTIEFVLEAGETAYVFLDSWSAGGAGTALFSFEAILLSNDEPCGEHAECLSEYCDADGSTCQDMPADYCGAIETVDVRTDGAEVDGGWELDFDTSGLADAQSPATADCIEGTTEGGEFVFVWTADRNETITVTTDLADVELDTLLYARVDGCLFPEAEVACNDDLEADSQSTIEVTLLTGETAYVFADSVGAGGSARVRFTSVETL
jgi:hypothetical protein